MHVDRFSNVFNSNLWRLSYHHFLGWTWEYQIKSQILFLIYSLKFINLFNLPLELFSCVDQPLKCKRNLQSLFGLLKRQRGLFLFFYFNRPSDIEVLINTYSIIIPWFVNIASLQSIISMANITLNLKPRIIFHQTLGSTRTKSIRSIAN